MNPPRWACNAWGQQWELGAGACVEAEAVSSENQRFKHTSDLSPNSPSLHGKSRRLLGKVALGGIFPLARIFGGHLSCSLPVVFACVSVPAILGG